MKTAIICVEPNLAIEVVDKVSSKFVLCLVVFVSDVNLRRNIKRKDKTRTFCITTMENPDLSFIAHVHHRRPSNARPSSYPKSVHSIAMIIMFIGLR